MIVQRYIAQHDFAAHVLGIANTNTLLRSGLIHRRTAWCAAYRSGFQTHAVLLTAIGYVLIRSVLFAFEHAGFGGRKCDGFWLKTIKIVVCFKSVIKTSLYQRWQQIFVNKVNGGNFGVFNMYVIQIYTYPDGQRISPVYFSFYEIIQCLLLALFAKAPVGFQI